MLIDSHCHFDLMDTATGDVLAAGQAEGVTSFLNVSVDLPSFPRVRQAAYDYENVYASVGIHPNSDQAGEADAAKLAELADDDKIIAIGETGLDYFRSSGDLAWQRDRFRYHIQAAKEVGKPLIIHCREAPEDTIKVLREENAAAAGGIMHCFVDDWDTAQAAMDMGFLISFSGIVTFKSAKDLKEVAKKMPLDMMLVETDSPYLAPVPHRGKPNQPAFVRHVAEHLAELRETDFDTIAHATTANFKRLFKLS